MTMKLTNNVISRMTMSKRCAGRNNEAGEITEVIQQVGELFATLYLADYIGFFKHLDVQGITKKVKVVRYRLESMMEEVIKEHEEARLKNKMDNQRNKGKDLVDLMIDLMEAEDSEMRFSRQSARAFVLEMFTAGTNSSASVMEWTLAEFIENPSIFQKARKEIDSVVGKNRLVRQSDIPNLPYLQAVVKETMRLHPPAPFFPRESTRGCKIGGYDVPANATLIVNEWAISRDGNYWDNPLEYNPERFIAKKNILDVRGQHY
ncbi:putative Cytochrome P450 [Quillaja saponaria]|uniref:Cytochrome P450 n=1 Tax=Quillaja saponaria TaxID=32244 RepID=A0AAD7L1K0_QUISA|nr:putative Cytochrome P450 [Quillaja saponaria]